jgi:very-short-patch-repair endonuclease
VIPQHEVAGYRVDLMVEGRTGRLAVECDGDRWPGAEAFERDLARQRMLERCGLPFARVRGAAFYRDPDVALEPLWATLDQYGIRAGRR